MHVCAEQAERDSVTHDMILCSMERGMLWMFLVGEVRRCRMRAWHAVPGLKFRGFTD